MTKEEQKIELINDLIATSTVLDELWNYHPNNPDRKDVVNEYETLKKIQSDIEKEIAELEK
tara:strand:+ start:825 stop:1007 length:183 start_codon:yes stop_codon:yes gene_type:complete